MFDPREARKAKPWPYGGAGETHPGVQARHQFIGNGALAPLADGAVKLMMSQVGPMNFQKKTLSKRSFLGSPPQSQLHTALMPIAD
jgi:hypothetical protein